ncbi:hypothetical protein SCHPADRAFT_867515 [Schizopora paradoxa]|uniref:FUN34 transmembrane protein n=1 Tax=Schizopora paradoxa TaxID=27342 RepID=A0A0H2S887_9AGAM|nr:hypothetical protein SCHPADRAFT_867515 [Schizopora paradoxa]
MSDIEKGQGVTATNGPANFPGPGAGHGAFVTLGATAEQQQYYQGGVFGLRKIANPAPLGLFSFASTTLILSLVNVQTDHVNTPNIVVGMALFVGGLCQLLAGMWEFAAGNTFGATAFSSYGGFWLSYAAIFIPNSGILAAYSETTTESQLGDAIGFYLAVWFIFTFCMLIGSLRSNAGLISLFFFLTLTFMFLTIAQYKPENIKIQKAGGGFGIVTAFIAYYCAAANLYSRESSFVSLPLAPIPKARSA